jgi:hypothetical protein
MSLPFALGLTSFSALARQTFRTRFARHRTPSHAADAVQRIASTHSYIRVFPELSRLCGTFSMIAASGLLQSPLGANVAPVAFWVATTSVSGDFDASRFVNCDST